MEFEVKNDLSRVANILGNLEDSTGLASSHLKNQSDDDSGWDTDLECEDETTSDAFDVVQVNKEKYVKACKECGVVPASYFLRNMTNVRLNMSHHGLGHKGAKAIAIGLMTNTHLTALDLSDNCLGSEGVSCICEMMIENCFISELDLSENNIGYEGVKHICALLMQSDSLKRLALRKNSLETKSAVILSNTLKSHTGLRFIDLSNNNFGEEAGLHFAPVISTNEYLEEINLSWNHLRQKGAFAIAKSLKENYTLKKLDLSWNGFGDDGIYVLSDSLIQNNSLQQLNLSSNRITHIGAGHLQKALKENEGLQVFKLGHNPLQHGVTFLIQGIKTNLNSTLVEFDLTDVQVNDEFITILNQLKTERTELQVYHGGLGGAPQKAAERPKPMRVLRDYIKNNQMRVFDLFKSLDKDKSMSISVAEFVAGLKETGVPLRIDELLTLVKSLDLDGDGEIDYREMVIGQQEMQKEEREEILRDKADRKRKKTLAQGLKPSTPSTGVRIRKSSPNPSLSPLRSPAHSRPTSPVSPRVTSPVLQRRRSRTFTPGYDDTSKDQKSNELLIPPSTAPGRKSPAQEI